MLDLSIIVFQLFKVVSTTKKLSNKESFLVLDVRYNLKHYDAFLSEISPPI